VRAMPLSPELLRLVCEFLDEGALSSAAAVSQSWRSEACTPALWEAPCRRRFPRMHADIAARLAKGASVEVGGPKPGVSAAAKGVGCPDRPGPLDGDPEEVTEEQLEAQRATLAAAVALATEDVERCTRQLGVLHSSHTAAVRELTDRHLRLAAEAGSLEGQLEDVMRELECLRLDHALSEASDESRCPGGLVDWRALFLLRLRQQMLWQERKGAARRGVAKDVGPALPKAAYLRTCTRCYRHYAPKDNTQRACRHHPGAYRHAAAGCHCGGSILHRRPSIDQEAAGLLLKCRRKGFGNIPSNWRDLLQCDCVFQYECCGNADAYSEGCALTQHRR